MSEDLPLTAEDSAEIAAIIEASHYRELDLSTRRFRLRLARADGADAGLTQEWQWAGSAPEAAVTEAELAADLAELVGGHCGSPFLNFVIISAVNVVASKFEMSSIIMSVSR